MMKKIFKRLIILFAIPIIYLWALVFTVITVITFIPFGMKIINRYLGKTKEIIKTFKEEAEYKLD